MDEQPLFNNALEKTDPRERAEYLDSACGGDLELRRRVESLLALCDEVGDFLEHPPILGRGHSSTSCRCLETRRDSTTVLSFDFLATSTFPGTIGSIDEYEVFEVVGRGAMGVVFKALDVKLNRLVAIKVPTINLVANPAAKSRFLREARSAAAAVHPNVVTIHAVGEIKGNPYLVMEFIDGIPLGDWIDREKRIGVEEIVNVGLQLAEALDAAHGLGLIHRDIKPANILLDPRSNRVKLTDFGLARAVDDRSVTRTGEVAGTPDYMSPEQASGDFIDHRTDLFSLGGVLYTICTGWAPFRAESTLAAIRRVRDDEPRPIREFNPGIPSWLCDVISRLLEKRPDARFQSAREVADILSRRLGELRQPAVDGPPETPVVARPRRFFTSIAASLFVLGIIGLGVTEVTGVTRLSRTVIRIATGDGVLLVKVDDPTVRVSIDGEGIRIGKAGIEEIRLAPGLHKVLASKDGRPIPLERDLVSVTSGGRSILTISGESIGRLETSDASRNSANPPPIPSTPPLSEVLTSPDFEWSEPVSLGFIAPGSVGQAYPNLADHDRTLVFVVKSDPGSQEHVWMATRSEAGDRWENPVPLPPPINVSEIDSGPFLSSDGLSLYFHSTRPGGKGSSDLWRVTRPTREAPWGAAINLGSPINTEGTEEAPSLSADELTLVFGSTRPGGAGWFDLYISRRKSRDEDWPAPQNLGPAINSDNWEGCPRISPDGLTLLFHTGRGGLRLSSRPTLDAPWSESVPIDPTGIEDFCCHPALSEDGRSILYLNFGKLSNPSHFWLSRRVRRADR